jgi:Fe-S oxidoreductase
VFKDEVVNLFGEQSRARRLADRTRLFSTVIRPHAERGELSSSTARALVQIHCHQRAIAGIDDTAAALRAAGLEASIPDAGCCGMAGSFGFDKDHYPVSIQAGERVLARAVREVDEDTIVIADGFSCREQIRHTTGRRAYHCAEVLERTGTMS